MLSIDPIARVIVSVSHAAASPTAFDTGLLLIKDTHYAEARRFQTVTSSAEALSVLATLGFAAGTDAAKCAQKYFAASPAPTRLHLSCYPSSETPIQALDAVLDISADFYGVAFADALTNEQALALSAHLEGLSHPAMLFLPLTGTAESIVAENSLLRQLNAAASRRCVALCASGTPDAAALMGTAMGLQLAHPASAFSLCYKTINAVTPSVFTQSQVEAIKALGGNVYVTRGYTHHLLENGSTPSGARYDEVLYLDMIADALQTAAVTLLAENPDRMPQTDDSTAQFINRFSAILTSWADRGVLASAAWRGSAAGPLSPGDVLENGFALWADSYDNQPEADRAAHRAVPIQVALILAGSLESVVISVSVQA